MNASAPGFTASGFLTSNWRCVVGSSSPSAAIAGIADSVNAISKEIECLKNVFILFYINYL